MRPIALLLAACALLSGVTAPAEAAVTEREVKAQFLPRFARYVTWPGAARPNGSDPYVLCVIGADPFGSDLDSAARSQSVDGRWIQVRRLESEQGAGGCHIAFVSGSRDHPVGQLLAAMRQRPILTVTDAKNGGQRGIVHFSMANGRVRFFIDEAQASQRGLSISARLLALAIAVRQR